jgi:precorrin-6B methylase 2
MAAPRDRTVAGMVQSRLRIGRRQVEALQIGEGFLEAHVLFALNTLDVFDHLAEGPRTADELAAELGVDADPLSRLLNAGVAAGLLSLADGRYANSDLVGTVLVSGSEGHLRDWMRWLARLAERFSGLADAVRTRKPVVDPSLHLGSDPDLTRDFIMAMHDYARLRGSEVVSYLDLAGASRLIDVGGGPGTYAILFARAWPDLEVTVFDLPDVVPLAKENCRTAGVGDRVRVVAGSYLEDELGEGFDVAFVSDVLHQESREAAVEVLRRVWRAIRPGGRLVVQGMHLNEDRVSPRWAAMASLIMLVLYGTGRMYTVAETVDMVEEAGFRSPEHVPMSLLNVNSLILAERP